jgi:serine/threonine-protein kinase
MAMAEIDRTATDPFETVIPSDERIGPVEHESASARFKSFRPLAKGGLGEVFVAIDDELKREVAVKEIQSRFADDAISRARFLREAALTGSLEHPGIIPVYALGRYSDGRPYYAMRLVRGESLQVAIDRYHERLVQETRRGEAAIELRRLLSRFVDVCNAVNYAHARGVVHRDLKPQNIMLGPFGETLVVDWGLAKVFGTPDATETAVERRIPLSDLTEPDITMEGSSIGTPQYMSPEQAEGRPDAGSSPSDVYSLGAVLYCIITGRAPFAGLGTAEVLERVVRGEVPAPTEVNGKSPRALESICLKAMARTPADRYLSPRALADDVERWLADMPVSAHREHPVRSLLRWIRHNKALVVGSVIFTATAIIGLALNDYGYRGANLIEITLSCVIAAQAVLLALLLRERTVRKNPPGAVSSDAAPPATATLSLPTVESRDLSR